MHISRASLAAGLSAALVAGGLVLSGGVAVAADKNCRDFSSQLEAQAYFSSRGGTPTNNVDNLDQNHNGVACEDYPYGSPGSTTTSAPTSSSTASTTAPRSSTTIATSAASSDVNCGDFPNQAAAQAYLVAHPDDRARLDGDNDGRACQDYPYATGGTGTLDDGSTAAVSGNQVRVVPEGSADTGRW